MCLAINAKNLSLLPKSSTVFSSDIHFIFVSSMLPYIYVWKVIQCSESTTNYKLIKPDGSHLKKHYICMQNGIKLLNRKRWFVTSNKEEYKLKLGCLNSLIEVVVVVGLYDLATALFTPVFIELITASSINGMIFYCNFSTPFWKIINIRIVIDTELNYIDLMYMIYS